MRATFVPLLGQGRVGARGQRARVSRRRERKSNGVGGGTIAAQLTPSSEGFPLSW